MDYTIDFLDKVAKASTAQIAAEFEKYGYKNPPKFSNAMIRIVLENAAQHRVQADGLTAAALDNVSKKIKKVVGKIEARTARR